MEWPDNCNISSGEKSIFGLDNLHEMNANSSEWTSDENKLFENGLAEIPAGSPGFLENIASRIPWKHIEDVKSYYEALVNDLHLIETDQVQISDYPPMEGIEKGSSSNSNATKRPKNTQWTEEEHLLFLMGLNKYGKGKWRKICESYLPYKKTSQISSHAQKYFNRQNSTTPVERRRPSINDIRTITPIHAPVPSFNFGASDVLLTPSFSYSNLGMMMDNHNHNPSANANNNPNNPAPAAHDVMFHQNHE